MMMSQKGELRMVLKTANKGSFANLLFYLSKLTMVAGLYFCTI
jgi:hypothetical protein